MNDIDLNFIFSNTKMNPNEYRCIACQNVNNYLEHHLQINDVEERMCEAEAKKSASLIVIPI